MNVLSILTLDMRLDTMLQIIRVGVDLIGVFFLIYFLITNFKKSQRTLQVFKGVILILIAKAITSFFGLATLNSQNQCLYKTVVPAEAIKATQAISDQLNFNYYFESNDYIYIRDKKDPKHIAFAKQWGMRDEVCVDEFDPEAIESYIGMIVVNDKKDIPAMVEALSPYYCIL